MREQSRYYWVDLAKVVSIFGVVFIHSLRDEMLSLSGYYFRFCVPVFLVTSFFLIERSQLRLGVPEAPIRLWKKRLPRLLIPFVIWSCFYSFVYLQASYSSPLKFITRHWLGFGWAGQYYFLILIQLLLLYPWLRQFKITAGRLFGIALFSLTALYLPLSYFSANTSGVWLKLGAVPGVYWIFYVCLGIYCARNYSVLQSQRWLNLDRRGGAIALILAPSLMVVEEILLRTWHLEAQPYFRISVLGVSWILVVGFIQIEVTLQQVMLQKIGPLWMSQCRKVLSSALRWLSAWTLGIFCMNPIIINLFNWLHFFILDSRDTSAVVSSLLKAGLIFTIAILASWLMSRLGAKALVQ